MVVKLYCDIPLLLRQPQKQEKGKSKDRAPKAPPVTQKLPITKLMLQVPPLSSATDQALQPLAVPYKPHWQDT